MPALISATIQQKSDYAWVSGQLLRMMDASVASI
jgi:hypothetical protein